MIKSSRVQVGKLMSKLDEELGLQAKRITLSIDQELDVVDNKSLKLQNIEFVKI
jgi:hypothetical protein